MSCSCQDSITVKLCTACGIEVTGGVAYSIGTQVIGATYTDLCNCVEQVYINGMTPPIQVNDGDAINVTIALKKECQLQSEDGPACYIPFFAHKKVGKQGVRTFANLNAIARHATKVGKRV